MNNLPEKESEYYLPMLYNKYLLELSGVKQGGNLYTMLRHGRYNAEIIRSVHEYITLLKQYYDRIDKRQFDSILSYDVFVRNIKINNIINED